MDYHKLLTDKLVSLNNGSIVTDLICTPTEHQIHSLLEGSGNPEAEMWQVNSSAGLAVNFWRAYELCHPESTVEFEWKKTVPLKRGIPANIDAVVRTDIVEDFYESKFLEPYYSNNEIPRDSYFDETKYSSYTKDNAASWVELFKKSSEFQYYNVTQLFRHLLEVSVENVKILIAVACINHHNHCEYILHSSLADIRTLCHDLCLCDFSKVIMDDVTDTVGFAGVLTDDFDPV